jgi:hypothetical protein
MSLRDAHIEIVRAADVTDARRGHGRATAPDQPWHARVRAKNIELTWSTETYVDKDGARGGIGQLAGMFSPVYRATVYADHVDVWLDDNELGAKHSIPIVEVDLRYAGGITTKPGKD